MDFNERLKQLRKEKNINQAVLAKELEYGYSAISNYESGRNEPSFTDLKKIASYFNVCLDYLLGVSDIRRPYNCDKNETIKEKYLAIVKGLNDESLSELVQFCEWLVYKQRKRTPDDIPYILQEYPSRVFKVADDKVEYKLE